MASDRSSLKKMFPIVLVYDGECSLCENFKERVMKWAPPGSVRPLTLKNGEVDHLLPEMTSDDRRQSFHLVWRDGRVKSGSLALPDILRLRSIGRPLAWALEHLPGGKAFMERLYIWVATHRTRS